MATQTFQDVLRSMAAYQALSELFVGQSVLEVGCAAGDGLRHLFALGARLVVGVDEDVRLARTRVQGLGQHVTVHAVRPPRLWVGDEATFDCVVVADAAQMASWGDWVTDLKERLVPGGALVLRTMSGDHSANAGGLGYGDLLDLVEDTFSSVRVFGQAPFVGYGVVELGREVDPDHLPLSLDLSLLGGEAEEVSTYLVVCSDGPLPVLDDLGLAVVQVPTGGEAALERWWDSLGAEASGSAEEEEPTERPPSSQRHDSGFRRARRAEGEERGENLEDRKSALQPSSSSLPTPIPSLALDAYLDGSGGRRLRWHRNPKHFAATPSTERPTPPTSRSA